MKNMTTEPAIKCLTKQPDANIQVEDDQSSKSTNLITLVPEDIIETATKKNSAEETMKDTQESTVSTKTTNKDMVRNKRREKRMRFQPKNVLDYDQNSNYYKEFLDEDDTIDLPQKLISMDYASGHAEELQSMLKALNQHSGNKTPMQTLPFRFRRRAAAHSSKRLPCRLRELAKKLGNENDKKVATRRKRRRNIHLQNEYAKRAGKQGWLETHLWHSKRFRMSSDGGHFTDWGCRVALDSYDKCFRASYRAVAKHCAIQDLSFFKFIEVSGKKKDLMDLLKRFLPSFELSRSKGLSRNVNEIEFLFYDKRTKPYQCVGPVCVMFTPVNEDNEERKMWFWLHPTLLQKIMNMLEYYGEKSEITFSDISKTLNRFRLTGPTSSVTLMSVLRSYKLKETSDENSAKQMVLIQSWLRKNKDIVEKQHSIFVSTMKKCHLDLFPSEDEKATSSPCNPGHVYSLVVNDPRLTLPLQKTKLDFKTSIEPTKYENTDDLPREGNCPLWKASYRNEFTRNWRLKNHMMTYLGRVFTETHRSKKKERTFVSAIFTLVRFSEHSSKVSSSRLPDHMVSTRICEAKFLPDDEKKKRITSLALPVPVALIRQGGHTATASIVEVSDDKATPSSRRTVHCGPPEQFGAGWDIIMPSNWAMAFWVPFIYHHAKPAALKNYYHSRLERKLSSFPRDYPDTEAGASWWKSEQQSNHTNYFKRPPSKRTNYAVLGTRFPFAPGWSCLSSNAKEVADANQITEARPAIGSNVLVSDDLKSEVTGGETASLKRSLDPADDEEPVAKIPRLDDDVTILPRIIRDRKILKELDQLIKSENSESLGQLDKFASDHIDELVGVKVSPLSKGVPAAQTTLCLPTLDDVEQLKAHFDDLNSKGLSDCYGPLEPKHWDPYRKERKEATKQAKKNRKRKKENKVKFERNLPFTFNVTPSREVLGFVTSGDFLFSFATGGGIAFVSIQALTSLNRIKKEHVWITSLLNESVHSCGLLCLMKNADTDQYRFATIDLDCN